MKWLLKGMTVALLTSQLCMAAPYRGEPISLNFQDVEVRSVLQVLADYAGINLVVSDTVQGNVTLRLHEVPWDQALALVLRSKGLARREEGMCCWWRQPPSWPNNPAVPVSGKSWMRSCNPCSVSCCRSITPRRPTSPSCCWQPWRTMAS